MSKIFLAIFGVMFIIKGFVVYSYVRPVDVAVWVGLGILFLLGAVFSK